MAAVMAQNVNKRKRDAQDLPNVRSAPGLGNDGSDFTQQYINTDDDDGIDNGETNVDFASVLAQHGNVIGQNENTSSESQPQLQQPQQRFPSQAQSGQNKAPGSASDTATAALAQYHTMTVPQPTEQSFMNQPTENGERASAATPGEQQTPTTQHRTPGFGGDLDFNAMKENQQPSADDSSPGNSGPQATPTQPKPSVGSDEWHKVRRDNHKEVERRRRETINEGINELAKIVPGCEKNKGSILARAVQFITQLKENESQNIEKWTLEKLLTEQAIAELSSSCDKLKAECQRAWSECEQWKKGAQKAGVTIDTTDEKGQAEEEAE